MKKNILLITLISILSNCDPIDKRIYLKNSSDDLVFYSISVSDTVMGRSPFVNSHRIVGQDTIWDESSNLLLADSGKNLTIIGKDAWEDYINNKCEDSTLRIFFFDKQLITTVPWDSIKTKRLATNKYSYKVKDLEKLNWKVEYKE